MDKSLSIKVFENGFIMATKNTLPVYCTSCGAYIGEIVPGYVKSVQCYCDAIVLISNPQHDVEEQEMQAAAF
jgi:hypothetical protein